MKEHFSDIFVTTDCPSQQELLDYVQGKLSPAARHEVEMHLADCELCSDALEGLSAIQHKEKIPGWLREMRAQLLKKLHLRFRRRRKRDSYIYIAIAILAVMILLLAIFWAYHLTSVSGR